MILFSIAAVALSTALLIVVGSLFDGFIDTLETTAQDFVGDVVVTPKSKFQDYDLFIEKLKADPDVIAATPVLSTQGLLHVGSGKVKGVNIWGIDPASRSKVTNFASSLLLQNDPNEEPKFNLSNSSRKMCGFSSIALLASPDPETDRYDFDGIKSEYISKRVVLTAGSISRPDRDVDFDRDDLSSQSNFKVKKIPFTISDIVFTGIHQLDDKYVYLPIEDLSRKLYPAESRNKNFANIIHIRLTDGCDHGQALDSIKEVWYKFARDQLGWSSYAIAQTKIETTKQMQAAHAAELRKQMNMLLWIFGIVSIAVVLLIFCIFYMIVTTKLKDIAIIKSFGASKALVSGIFMIYGLFVGILGVVFGFALGAVITININVVEQAIQRLFGLKLWDSSIYLFAQTPNQIDYSTVAWVLPAAVIASVVGAIIPAVSASKIVPVKILQYE